MERSKKPAKISEQLGEALFVAQQDKYYRPLRKALDSGEDPNRWINWSKRGDRRIEPPLFFYLHRFDIVNALLEGGADPDCRSVDPPIWDTPLRAACSHLDADAVSAFLKWHADPNGWTPITNETALICAARSWPSRKRELPLPGIEGQASLAENARRIVRELVAAGADTTLVDDYRWSALDYMREYELPSDVIAELGNIGDQWHEVDRWETCPDELRRVVLQSLVAANRLDWVELWLSRMDQRELDPLFLGTLLVIACRIESPLAFRLIDMGAMIDFDFEDKKIFKDPEIAPGSTPLIAATKSGWIAMVRELIQRGAKVDRRDHSSGRTALQHAKSPTIKGLLEDYVK